MTLFKKLILPAALIVVLAGCGNMQDAPTEHAETSSSSSTWDTDTTGNTVNGTTDDYAENEDDLPSTENAGSNNFNDNSSTSPVQETSPDSNSISTTVKTTTSVETSVSAGSSTSVETSTSVEMNHSPSPSQPTTSASGLSTQASDNLLQYLEECTQMLHYMGQEMKQAADFSTMQEPTIEKVVAQIASHRKNIDSRLQRLESLTIPQIDNPSIREKVVSIRNHTLDMGNTASDMMQLMSKYMQTDDEGYYEKYQKMSDQVNASYLALIEQAAQLAIEVE
ncbi:hypothetical protein [Paenibacillus bovis]|uniref:DUF305 domain-containing protein n=1 Tax=Paenibacillus bovis TaxID=1616788 RepID=A0A172ZKD6_9BACL|nr:hypothetical protein [Paenibacillus bovis]ANF97872.1 hypothetical protein AR543_18860 [Paenibacillus bovis]